MRKSTSDALLNAGNHLKEDAASFIKSRPGKAACGGSLAGWIFGGSTGVALLGTAINGAWIFAPLAGLLTWLWVTRRQVR